MNNFFHTNISFYATNKAELYAIWDDDLKKANKKRVRWELVLCIATLLVCFGDTLLLKGSFLGVAIFALAQLLKYFIDESNINYLMHKIDIDDLNLDNES